MDTQDININFYDKIFNPFFLKLVILNHRYKTTGEYDVCQKMTFDRLKSIIPVFNQCCKDNENKKNDETTIDKSHNITSDDPIDINSLNIESDEQNVNSNSINTKLDENDDSFYENIFRPFFFKIVLLNYKFRTTCQFNKHQENIIECLKLIIPIFDKLYDKIFKLGLSGGGPQKDILMIDIPLNDVPMSNIQVENASVNGGLTTDLTNEYQDIKPKSEHQSEPQSEHQSEPQSEHQSEHQSGPQSEPKSEHQSEPQSEHQSEPKSEHQSEHQSEPKSEPRHEPRYLGYFELESDDDEEEKNHKIVMDFFQTSLDKLNQCMQNKWVTITDHKEEDDDENNSDESEDISESELVNKPPETTDIPPELISASQEPSNNQNVGEEPMDDDKDNLKLEIIKIDQINDSYDYELYGFSKFNDNTFDTMIDLL